MSPDDRHGEGAATRVAAEDLAERAVWTTNDGRKLRLGDMSDQHLRNAAAMLERKARQLDHLALDALGYAAGAPDGAAMAAEGEAMAMCDRAHIFDVWARAMRQVLERRPWNRQVPDADG